MWFGLCLNVIPISTKSLSERRDKIAVALKYSFLETGTTEIGCEQMFLCDKLRDYNQYLT